MPSIAKLAVILSAVTTPLEQGLKAAQSKVSSFSGSILSAMKGGFGAGLGLMGLDKLEKALKTNKELAAVGDEIEAKFGNIVIKAFELDKVMKLVHATFQKIDELVPNGGLIANFKPEDFIRPMNDKEKALQKAMEKEAANMVGNKEMKELVQKLQAQMEGLDPHFEDNLVARFRRMNPDAIDLKNIDMLRSRIKFLQQDKQAAEDAKRMEEERLKVMEQGKSLTDNLATPLEKLAKAQAEYNKMLGIGAINQETFGRAIKALTPGLKELEAIQDEIFKLEKGQMAFDLKKLKEAGASKDILDQYEKDFKRLEKLKEEWPDIPDDSGTTYGEKPQQFAEALSGERALGAIMKAQAGMKQTVTDPSRLMEKHIEESQRQTKIHEDIRKKQGDALEIWKRIKPSNVVRL